MKQSEFNTKAKRGPRGADLVAETGPSVVVVLLGKTARARRDEIRDLKLEHRRCILALAVGIAGSGQAHEAGIVSDIGRKIQKRAVGGLDHISVVSHSGTAARGDLQIGIHIAGRQTAHQNGLLAITDTGREQRRTVVERIGRARKGVAQHNRALAGLVHAADPKLAALHIQRIIGGGIVGIGSRGFAVRCGQLVVVARDERAIL